MPIIKGTTNIGAIYKGTTNIERVYRGINLVFQAYAALTAEGTPPIILINCLMSNLLDYKIYGNTTQDGTPTLENPVEIESVGDPEIYSPNNLPDAYEEVEYLESTTTQYIDTGLVGKPGYTLETEMAHTQIGTGSYQYFAGYAYTGSADRTYYTRLNSGDGGLGYTYGSQNSDTVSLITITAGRFYKIKAVMKADAQEFYSNDRLIGTSSYGTLPYDEGNPVTIYMFTSQYVGGTNGGCYAKCKWAKWYDENDNLVRHFIPCFRKSDNVAGMYDLVNDVFYTNAGTGDFILGPSTVRYKIPVKVRRIPSEYQEVEYLKSTGTQYIDTGVVPSANFKFEIKYKDVSASGSNYVMGSRSGANNTVFTGIGGGSSAKNISINNHNTTTPNSYRQKNYEYEVTASYNSSLTGTSTLKCLTTGGTFTGNQTGSIASASANIMVFAFRSGQEHTGMALQRLKIWQDGTNLSRDFIPCYRKLDGDPGLYDIVNNTFYTNDGSGEFAVGNDVGITNIYLDQPLRKVGDYADYIDFANQKVVRQVFGETITSVVDSSSATYRKFLSSLSHRPLITGSGTSQRGTAMATIFQTSTYTYNQLGSHGGYIQPYITSSSANRVVYTFDDTSVTTIATAQALIGDGFEAIYQLATPIEETIVLPEILVGDGTNTVEVLTDTQPSNMWVRYKGSN